MTTKKSIAFGAVLLAVSSWLIGVWFLMLLVGIFYPLSFSHTLAVSLIINLISVPFRRQS
jgi:hypothetical protein